MQFRPLLPTAAIVTALAATSAVYRLAPHSDLPHYNQRDADLNLVSPPDPAAEAHCVRSMARDLAVREVIAGRASVTEAAALFGWLDGLPPRQWATSHDQLAVLASLPDAAGYTEAELLGARVVALVEVVSCDDAAQPGCVERVRREFFSARAEGQFARLPTPPAARCALLLEQARVEAARTARGRAG
jgi:hypothetical protein